MNKYIDFQKKNLSSNKTWRQILGALLEWKPISFLAFILFTLVLAALLYGFHQADTCSILELFGLNLIVWLTVKTCNRLLDLFNLLRKETAITWSYIIILLAFGGWIIGFLLIFKIQNDGRVAAAVAAIGAVISLIYKDKITGVFAFFHLRMHHFLNIGDWIKIPDKNVDGEVQKFTLTSVQINNWDTTTSIIPISMLQSEHFINLKNMMDGKTYGRKMLKTFVFDTSWFCPLTKENIRAIEKKHNINLHLKDEEIGDSILNAKVYRLYLYHWLMNNEHVSQQPRLIVSWLEQKESGMPLQVYAFITDSSLASFEWQQSQIIEHIIESASWFNMQLFQEASAFDVSNNNIFLTKKPAEYRKENLL